MSMGKIWKRQRQAIERRRDAVKEAWEGTLMQCPAILIPWLLQAIQHTALALKCSVCRDTTFMGVGPYQNELDRFRVSYNVPRPYCRVLDYVECDRDHDLCATIVTRMPQDQGYWIGMGCGSRDKFPQESGCERIAQDTRSVSYDRGRTGRRRVVEDRAVQDICVCTYDYCNVASSLGSHLPLLILAPLLAAGI